MTELINNIKWGLNNAPLLLFFICFCFSLATYYIIQSYLDYRAKKIGTPTGIFIKQTPHSLRKEQYKLSNGKLRWVECKWVNKND